MTRYYRPSTLAEALDIRASRSVTILAGGTDIYPARAARAGWGDFTHPDILDISIVEDLERIDETEDGFRFGAMVTWSALDEFKLPPLFDGYKRAARAIGGQQVQNRGTLIGNICTASPAGDGIPNLLALAAEVELRSRDGGTRLVPMADFITGYRKTVCRSDEIATALIVPKLPGGRGEFLKLGARSYLVISIVMAAGVIAVEAGKIAEARIAVGACSAVPTRLPALEAALLDQLVGEADQVPEEAHLAALAPIDDIRGSAAYRRAAALTMIRELLGNLAAPPERKAA
jgi:xanthine dehydrogenase small subunit